MPLRSCRRLQGAPALVLSLHVLNPVCWVLHRMGSEHIASTRLLTGSARTPSPSAWGSRCTPAGGRKQEGAGRQAGALSLLPAPPSSRPGAGLGTPESRSRPEQGSVVTGEMCVGWGQGWVLSPELGFLRCFLCAQSWWHHVSVRCWVYLCAHVHCAL